MNVQRAIFPGVIAGIFILVAVTGMLRAAGTGAQGDLPESRVAATEVSGADLPELLEVGSISAAGVLDIQIIPMANPALPDDGVCSISPAYPEAIQQWCGIIERYAAENGLDANLIAALILRESSGQPDAYSKSGAVGLMQVMPNDGLAKKFTCKGGPCFANRPGMKELFDPQFNVAYGCRMLAELVQEKGNMRDALKAYGPLDVGYRYADLVLETYQQYR